MTRFLRLWAATSTWAVCSYASSVYGFVSHTDHQGDDYAHVVYEEFLGALISIQLRVLPAYLLVALACAVLLFPLLANTPALAFEGRWRRARLMGRVALYAAPVYVLSLGPFFDHSPGLLDGWARWLSVLAPGVDVYAIRRWRVLEILSAGFALLCLWDAAFYLQRWWGAVREASGRRRVVWVSALAVPALGFAWSVTPPAPPPAAADTPLNVLVIASDSLRWDHLGAHGYQRDTSPNIDRFAADAADLTRLHVTTASTLESWMSTFSSRFPPNHGVRYMYLPRHLAERAGRLPGMLPRMLSERGYRTSVVSNWAGDCFQLVDFGFTHNHASQTQNFEAIMMESTVWAHHLFPLYFTNDLGAFLLPEVTRVTKYVRPDALNDRMLAEIDAASRAGQPFFGLLFYSSTHLPYTPSHPFNTKWVDPAYDGPHRFQIDVKVHELITTGFAPTMPAEVIQHIRDLYDGGVSEFDHYVGEMIAALKRRGLYDRTIVVVTSDHGEDLYDPGSTLGHGTNFFGGDQSTRIPLFIRVPELTRPGQKVELLARNVDLAPTLLSLLGGDPPPEWQGVDLTPALRGEVDDLDLPVFAETCYLFFPKGNALVDLTDDERARLLESKGARDTLKIDKTFNNNMVLDARFHDEQIRLKDRMVRTRRWKLVEVPAEGEPILRLYDMEADPRQTRDLAAGGHPIVPHLKRMLDAYWRGDAGPLRWPVAWEDPERLPALTASGSETRALP